MADYAPYPEAGRVKYGAFGLLRLLLVLPDSAMQTYQELERYGFVILLGLLWVVPQILHVDPLGAYFAWTVEPFAHLLLGI